MAYSIEDFKEAGFYEEKVSKTETVELKGGKVVAHLKISKQMLELLNTPKGDLFDGDFSRQDAAVITALLSSGLSPADSFATFVNSPRGKDAEIRKSGHFRDYVERTIRKAAGFIKVKLDFSPRGLNLPSTGEIQSIIMSEVMPEKVHWLWNKRIPYGKVTIIAGDPGMGKSTMALDIASRISRGGKSPDGERMNTGSCLIASAEDGLADTIRPRLQVAEARLERIHALKFVVNEEGQIEGLSLPQHLGELNRKIQQTSCRLVVIDPFNAYLPSRAVDTNKDQDIRGVLSVMSEIAEQNNTAIVLVSHLTKKEETGTLYRIGGSIGLIAAARSALVVVRHPDDRAKKILCSIKNNLSAPPEALSYEMQGCQETVKIHWTGAVDYDPFRQAAVPEAKSKAEATSILKQVLEEGPVEVRIIYEEAKRAGLATRNLRTAKESLGAKSKKIGEKWYWSL